MFCYYIAGPGGRTRGTSGGLTCLLGYTLSKSIDDGSGKRVLGTDNLQPQISYWISCECVLSIFNQKQRFVSSVLYELPFVRGQAHMNKRRQCRWGWDLGGIWSMASGAPIEIFSGNDQYNTGIGNDRPNVVPGVDVT